MTIYFTNLMIMYSVILLKGNMLQVKCVYLPLYVWDMFVDHHRIYVYIWYFYHRHSNLWSIRSIAMSIMCCLYMLTIFLSYVTISLKCGVAMSYSEDRNRTSTQDWFQKHCKLKYIFHLFGTRDRLTFDLAIAPYTTTLSPLFL